MVGPLLHPNRLENLALGRRRLRPIHSLLRLQLLLPNDRQRARLQILASSAHGCPHLRRRLHRHGPLRNLRGLEAKTLDIYLRAVCDCSGGVRGAFGDSASEVAGSDVFLSILYTVGA